MITDRNRTNPFLAPNTVDVQHSNDKDCSIRVGIVTGGKAETYAYISVDDAYALIAALQAGIADAGRVPTGTKETEPEPEPFVLDSTVYGRARVGTLHAAPADIVRAFGPANVGASGDNKVDREWCFRSREGYGVSVYAYKATSLYADDLPSPSDFWSSEDVYRDLSVSGPNEHVGEAFIKWAQAKIAEVGGK